MIIILLYRVSTSLTNIKHPVITWITGQLWAAEEAV